jgi:hypothetical protein
MPGRRAGFYPDPRDTGQKIAIEGDPATIRTAEK